MDTRLFYLTLLAMVVTGFTRALNEDLPAFRSLAKKWRALLIAGLGIIGGTIDKEVAGATLVLALQTVLAISGPGFFVLLFEALGGKSDPGAGDSGKRTASLAAPLLPTDTMKLGPVVIIRPDRHKFIRKLGMALALLAMASCVGGLPAFINDAVLVAENAADILAALKSASAFYLQGHPVSADEQAKIESAFEDASLALATALSVTRGTKDITYAQADAAFDDFRAAYTSYTALLKSNGVVVPDKAKGVLMAFRGGALLPIAPLAMGHLRS
jgi:hypothetical protein